MLNMNAKYKRLISDMGIFALGALGSKLIVFFLLPLYTHILSTEEYGISDLIFTIGQLVLPFISLAIFNGLLRYGLMRDVKSEDALWCATIVFVLGSTIMVLITPLVGLIPSIRVWKWYLCAYVVSSFAVSNALVYLKVKDKNKLYSLLSILQTLSLVACNIVFLLLFDLGIRGYLLSYIVSNFVAAFCAFLFGGLFGDLRNANYRPDLMKAMILFSLPYILNDISWWAIHSANKLLIELIIGSAVLGIYTTASKIPSLINVIASIFTQAWGLSSIKEYDSSNDTKFYSNVFSYFIITIFGFCVVIISIIKVFMRIYVSPDFFEAWQYIPLLLVAAVFSAVSAFAGSLLGAMKKSQNLMWTTLAAGLINIIINVVLLPVYGLWGAAVGTLIANLVVATLRLINIKKHLSINYNLRYSLPLVMLVMIHAVLVSIDFHIVFVSIATITIYAYLSYMNFKSITYVSDGGSNK